MVSENYRVNWALGCRCFRVFVSPWVGAEDVLRFSKEPWQPFGAERASGVQQRSSVEPCSRSEKGGK